MVDTTAEKTKTKIDRLLVSLYLLPTRALFDITKYTVKISNAKPALRSHANSQINCLIIIYIDNFGIIHVILL